MYIRTQKVLRELDIDFKNDEPIGFVFTKPHEATVEVRQASPEEQQLGYKKGTLLCTVSISLDTSAEIAAIFQSLANNRLPEGSKEPTKWNDYIDQAGNITDKYVVTLHLLPKAAQNFCDEGNEKLSILVRNALSILRWRYGLTGPHNPVSAGSLPEWSFDNKQWKPLPTTISVEAWAFATLAGYRRKKGASGHSTRRRNTRTTRTCDLSRSMGAEKQ